MRTGTDRVTERTHRPKYRSAPESYLSLTVSMRSHPTDYTGQDSAVDEAIATLTARRGSMYDPLVVDVFIERQSKWSPVDSKDFGVVNRLRCHLAFRFHGARNIPRRYTSRLRLPSTYESTS